MAWLKRRDRNGQLEVQNIADPGFDAGSYGLSREEVERVLHGIRPDGSVVKGMEAVRAAYCAVGLGWVVAPTRIPGVRWLADSVYRSFARNRAALGRLVEQRCSDERCAEKPSDDTACH